MCQISNEESREQQRLNYYDYKLKKENDKKKSQNCKDNFSSDL